MSNDAASVIAVARSQVGIRSGKTYWDYVMGGGYVSGSATPWCACFVSWVFHKAGARCAGLPAASCTYGIYPKALAAKAVRRASDARPGDVVLFNFDRNESDAEHVGIVEEVHDGWLRTIEGNTNAVGSSTGGQVARKVRPIGNVFAIVRPDYEAKAPPKQPASKRVNDFGLAYRAHVQTAGWLPVVYDGQVAGTVGQSTRLEALKFSPPKGVRLDVEAHMQGIGWRRYDGVERGKCDPVIGTTGERRRLEAVRIRAEGLPEGKRLRYRAHVQGVGWQAWREAGQVAGTTGERRRLEAIQVEVI